MQASVIILTVAVSALTTLQLVLPSLHVSVAQVLTGPADLQFALYDALTDGNLLGTQTLAGVVVSFVSITQRGIFL